MNPQLCAQRDPKHVSQTKRKHWQGGRPHPDPITLSLTLTQRPRWSPVVWIPQEQRLAPRAALRWVVASVDGGWDGILLLTCTQHVPRQTSDGKPVPRPSRVCPSSTQSPPLPTPSQQAFCKPGIGLNTGAIRYTH